MEDSSEDVNEFLLRIRELGDKRVKEDEDRARKLEEEILQGRKERQARRAGKQYPARTKERKKERESKKPTRLVGVCTSDNCLSSLAPPLPCTLDLDQFLERVIGIGSGIDLFDVVSVLRLADGCG